MFEWISDPQWWIVILLAAILIHKLEKRWVGALMRDIVRDQRLDALNQISLSLDNISDTLKHVAYAQKKDNE